MIIYWQFIGLQYKSIVFFCFYFFLLTKFETNYRNTKREKERSRKYLQQISLKGKKYISSGKY